MENQAMNLGVTQEELNKLTDLLSRVRRKANEVNNAPVRDVSRQYRNLVELIEEFDELSRNLGVKIVQHLDFERENIETDEGKSVNEVFWTNEYWSHPDFEGVVEDEYESILYTIYSLPFSREISGAYDEREKVERALFAAEEAVRKSEDIEEVRTELFET